MRDERNQGGQSPDLNLKSKLELALRNSNLQSQMVRLVVDNFALIDNERAEIQKNIEENYQVVDRINGVVASAMAELENEPQNVIEERLLLLSQNFGDIYGTAESAIPELTNKLDQMRYLEVKHEEFAELLLGYEIGDTYGVEDSDSINVNTLVSAEESVLLESNTVEAEVLRMLLISLDKTVTEEALTSPEIDTSSQALDLLMAEKDDIASKRKNFGWVLKNPLEMARLVRRQQEIEIERKRLETIINDSFLRKNKFVEAVRKHQELREKIVEFYNTKGGINLITLRQPEEIIVEDEENEMDVNLEIKDLDETGKAILDILLSTSGRVTVEAEDSQDVSVTQETRMARALRFSWEEFFGPELREGMTDAQYNSYVQNFRFAVRDLVLSPKLEEDVDMPHYRNLVKIDYATNNKAKIDYQGAINLIDGIVRVKHLKAVFSGLEQVARIIALVYKQTSGTFKNHHEFIELANEVQNSDLYGDDLLIRDIVEIMILDQTDTVFEQPEDLTTSEEVESQALAENIQKATANVKVGTSEREMSERNLAKGIVVSAIDTLNKQAANEGMYYKFPVSLDVTFSKPQADKLMGGLANSRHRTYERHGVDDSLKMDAVDMIISSLWKSNRTIATNKSLMKRLAPIIREVYEEIFESSQAGHK